MLSQSRLIAALVLVISLPTAVAACLWDYDTLKQERAEFPGTLELITGKFLRHSKEFYEWRIQDRLKKLESAPSHLDYYDDLAVAYEKSGQHGKAIETILAKETIKPGLYETYANLGTFHVLAGDFEQGLPYIDKALALNFDAHFGREKYQKWLVEYALTRQKDGQLALPLQLSPADADEAKVASDFHAYLAQRLNKLQLSLGDTKAAVEAIQGMMRFANYDNPLLLETLGDLLSLGDFESTDAKRLAARAYLKASYGAEVDATKKAYRKLAEEALSAQSKHSNSRSELALAELESEFAKQMADAESWYAELKAKELSWIREGKNADAEFDRLYSVEPVALGEASDDATNIKAIIFNILLVALILGGVLVLGTRIRRWRTARS